MMRPVSLGAVAERVLSRFAITDRLVSSVLRVKSCGCSKRRDLLDAWGYRVQYRIIMYLGGPATMTWRARFRFARRRLWKTIVSKLAPKGAAGSGGTRR